MANMIWWYTLAVIILSIAVAILFNYSAEHFSENIRKLVVILSFFTIFGVCLVPVEDKEKNGHF